MLQPMLRSAVAFLLVILLSGTPALLQAQPAYSVKDQPDEPSAEAIVADVLILRPIGFLATVLGAVLYVVALPISLPTRSADVVGEKLVVNPAKYTFVRPVGASLADIEVNPTR